MGEETKLASAAALDLRDQLALHADHLRDPAEVMSPERMGAARPTRHAFGRSLLRRAFSQGWTTTTTRFDVDPDGRGEVGYRIDAEGYRFTFVAFLQTLPEAAHSDRVIAERWEIAAALVEGDIADDGWEALRTQVCAQEEGRFCLLYTSPSPRDRG